ncbi:MAG: hypothetical protein IPO34_20810 [Dehalococcoidia bacterium]|nr:hypothetical protein [Dehalococcoidia bacterium]
MFKASARTYIKKFGGSSKEGSIEGSRNRSKSAYSTLDKKAARKISFIAVVPPAEKGRVIAALAAAQTKKRNSLLDKPM